MNRSMYQMALQPDVVIEYCNKLFEVYGFKLISMDVSDIDFEQFVGTMRTQLYKHIVYRKNNPHIVYASTHERNDLYNFVTHYLSTTKVPINTLAKDMNISAKALNNFLNRNKKLVSKVYKNIKEFKKRKTEELKAMVSLSLVKDDKKTEDSNIE